MCCYQSGSKMTDPDHGLVSPSRLLSPQRNLTGNMLTSISSGASAVPQRRPWLRDLTIRLALEMKTTSSSSSGAVFSSRTNSQSFHTFSSLQNQNTKHKRHHTSNPAWSALDQNVSSQSDLTRFFGGSQCSHDTCWDFKSVDHMPSEPQMLIFPFKKNHII